MKIIENTNGNYAVHKDGVIYRMYKNGREPRAMIPLLTDDGYCYHRLMVNGTQTMLLVHRIVAEAYLPNTDGNPCVDHKDEDKTFNAVSNLRWCTYHENMAFYNNGGKSVDRVPYVKSLLAKAKEVRTEIKDVSAMVEEQIVTLQKLQKSIEHSLKLMAKNDRHAETYKGFKDTTGVSHGSIAAMVAATGKPVSIKDVGEFPSAGSAARYIVEHSGRGDKKDISKRIRKYIADPKRTVCTIFKTYTIL